MQVFLQTLIITYYLHLSQQQYFSSSPLSKYLKYTDPKELKEKSLLQAVVIRTRTNVEGPVGYIYSMSGSLFF